MSSSSCHQIYGASLGPYQDISSRSIPTPLRTIDTYRLSNIILMKIDVGAAEAAVLDGSKLMLGCVKHALLIQVEQRYSTQRFLSTFELVQEDGYQCFLHGNKLLRSD